MSAYDGGEPDDIPGLIIRNTGVGPDKTLDETAPELIQALQHLFDEYGPLGVQRTVLDMRARLAMNEFDSDDRSARGDGGWSTHVEQPNPFARVEDIPELLGQLAGAASMCWNPRPNTEVFDSEVAGVYVNQALDRLGEMIDLGPSNNTLERDLARVLNRHSQENRSNTPDHLLASYVLKVLDAGNALINRRSHWWSLPTAFSELVEKPWTKPASPAPPTTTDPTATAQPWGEPTG
jgi:hypothetical protein